MRRRRDIGRRLCHNVQNKSKWCVGRGVAPLRKETFEILDPVWIDFPSEAPAINNSAPTAEEQFFEPSGDRTRFADDENPETRRGRQIAPSRRGFPDRLIKFVRRRLGVSGYRSQQFWNHR